MDDSIKIIELLDLTTPASLFVGGMSLNRDSSGFVLALNFCHVSGIHPNPSIVKFVLTFRDCHNLKTYIEGSDEAYDRPSYLHEYSDVLGIKLGAENFDSDFSLHCDGIEISFTYKDFSIKREN